MQRVSALPPDRWPALIGALNSLAAQRDLQAYFTSDLVEQEITRVGWSGAVNPTGTQDYMMEIESNYYGDKVNYFLTRQYSLVLTRNGGLLHHQLTVDYVNDAICGSYDRTSYRADIRVYASDSETSASDSLRSVKYANPPPPAGLGLVNGWLPDVPCGGGRGRAVFDYDTPWPTPDKGLDRIYWQKQPGTGADRINVTWNAGRGRTFTVSGRLGQDQLITVSPGGVSLTPGQPAQAALPSLSLG
jgi:hypothetical protein